MALEKTEGIEAACELIRDSNHTRQEAVETLQEMGASQASAYRYWIAAYKIVSQEEEDAKDPAQPSKRCIKTRVICSLNDALSLAELENDPERQADLACKMARAAKDLRISHY